MKTWQALKAADEGKKIRRKWWAASMYSCKDESRFCNPALITHYGTLEKESLEDLISRKLTKERRDFMREAFSKVKETIE